MGIAFRFIFDRDLYSIRSILDYADICDFNEYLLNKQCLQNLCASYNFWLRKLNHVAEYRRTLQWLPIKLRREEHVLSLLYNGLYNPRTPAYLKEHFRIFGVT